MAAAPIPRPNPTGTSPTTTASPATPTATPSRAPSWSTSSRWAGAGGAAAARGPRAAGRRAAGALGRGGARPLGRGAASGAPTLPTALPTPPSIPTAPPPARCWTICLTPPPRTAALARRPTTRAATRACAPPTRSARARGGAGTCGWGSTASTPEVRGAERAGREGAGCLRGALTRLHRLLHRQRWPAAAQAGRCPRNVLRRLTRYPAVPRTTVRRLLALLPPVRVRQHLRQDQLCQGGRWLVGTQGRWDRRVLGGWRAGGWVGGRLGGRPAAPWPRTAAQSPGSAAHTPPALLPLPPPPDQSGPRGP